VGAMLKLTTLPTGEHGGCLLGICAVPAASAHVPQPAARLAVAPRRSGSSLQGAHPPRSASGLLSRTASFGPAAARTAASRCGSPKATAVAETTRQLERDTATAVRADGSRAVVIGGSVAGILAAAAASPFFDEVTRRSTLLSHHARVGSQLPPRRVSTAYATKCWHLAGAAMLPGRGLSTE